MSAIGVTRSKDGRSRFSVWAPCVRSVALHVRAPHDRLLDMQPLDQGYYEALVEGAGPGTFYTYVLDGEKERPDPASRFQPAGVHGCSQVIDSQFDWEDDHWAGLPLDNLIFYELHVGTFTPEGTFDGIVPHLDYLRDLGVTAIQLMPVAQFPGGRNWGYDGVQPFAVQNTYGGPEGLRRLVNACHRRGLAVSLDVVYNHIGPEGNYLADFGPYFTDVYRTPWGPALNFDGPGSDEVRRFFIENARYWVTEFHMDALRLDAVHAIFDRSAQPFLQELAEAVHRRAEELNRRVHVIAESDLNDSRLIRPRELGGFGLDAQWSDDFHHALHTLLTGERTGYYEDFGRIEHLVKAYREGFVYSGQYSRYRGRRHGNSAGDLAASKFVVCVQNHDQVGNRMLGERLSTLVGFEELKLAAAAVLLSPYVPLLFMGEEYSETRPFRYFVSHGDPELIEAVRCGRREEFAEFHWQGEAPDPQDEATFCQAKLDHALRHEGRHRILLEFYRELIRLRRELPGLATLSSDHVEAVGFEAEKIVFLRRWEGEGQVWAALNFSSEAREMSLPVPPGHWEKRLDSAEKRWGGNGSPFAETLDPEVRLTLRLNPKSVVLFAPAGM